MRRRYLLVLALVVAVVLVLAGQAAASREATQNTGDGCSQGPLPEILYVAPGEMLEAGAHYLLIGPQNVITDVFSERLWEASYADGRGWLALVVPAQDTPWPPEGYQDPPSASSFNGWRVLQGWRPPFLMYSPMEGPLDVASLGSFKADDLVRAEVLDHSNYIYEGQERPVSFFLIRPNGSELGLGELEIAEPAFKTIVVPQAGELQVRTHDSTVWWAECLPPPSIDLSKTATPDSLPEPGGPVEFAIEVGNTSPLPLELTSLTDDVYGDITSEANTSIISTTCALGQSLASGESYACAFTAEASGEPGDTQTDTVTAVAVDPWGRQAEASASATVTFTDLASSIRVTKNAYPTSVPEPGANVQFRVVVKNTSRVDTVTIHSLVDDQYGDIGRYCEAALPFRLAPDESVTCDFTEYIAGRPGDHHTNVAAASGIDDDGRPVSDQDSAEVLVEDVPSQIEVIKTAFPYWIQYPGDDVSFNITVNNVSTVDWVSIDVLKDTIYGDLDGQGNCSLPQTLRPGGSYACSFTTFVSGAPESKHINVVLAAGVDDDGQPVSDQDSAEVTIAAVVTEVGLVYFRSSATENTILIEWQTSFEQNNWGFNLYRGLGPAFEEAAWVHFAQARGDGRFEGQSYEYQDADVVRGQHYYYWLEDVELAGSATRHGPLEALLPYRTFVPLAGR